MENKRCTCDYKDLKFEKPKEADKVWVEICEKPMNPKPAIYKKGKFKQR